MRHRSIFIFVTVGLLLCGSPALAQGGRIFTFSKGLTISVPAGAAIHAAQGNWVNIPLAADQALHIIHASANVRDELNAQRVIADSVNILLRTNGTLPINFSLSANSNAGLVLGECNAFLNDFTLLSDDFAANGGINPVNLVTTSSLRNTDLSHPHSVVLQLKVFYEILPNTKQVQQ